MQKLLHHDLEKMIQDEITERARDSFLAFVLATDDQYEVNWHHKLICKKLNAFMRGEIQYLMIFTHPRAGKSELVSRKLPAFWHGKKPDHEIMAVSYLDSLAGDMTVSVQKIIDSESYKKIFPETKILPPSSNYSKGIRNSEGHTIIGHKGIYRGQGVGGSFTGKGANLCFLPGTRVQTASGEIGIEKIQVGQQVYSVDHITGNLELQRVTATSKSLANETIQTTLSTGRAICSTPSHKFYVPEKQSYFEIQKIDRGTKLHGFKELTKIELSKKKKHDLVYVYDLQVEKNHNFFAENVLVHNCLIDDPIKGREIADSLAFRERLWAFYTNDLFTRLETNLKTGEKGQVLLTQTRWHPDDLAGRLLDRMKNDPLAQQWEVLELPAIKVSEENQEDPRKIGEALWPKKYGVKQLESIKAAIGPRAWASLYQQQPYVEGGGLFRDSMFYFCDLPQAFDWSFHTMDTSYTDRQTSDYTVLSHWGMRDGELYLINCFRQQILSADVERHITPLLNAARNRWGYRGVWIEPKGHGIYLNQHLPRKGILVPSERDRKEFFSDRSRPKDERANNVIPHLATRKIGISNSISNKEDLLAEALNFPSSKHDDFVDTLVDACKIAWGRPLSILDVL